MTTKTDSVWVRVPGTTANLGSGFDCIGAALSLYNTFKFSSSEQQQLKIAVRGTEASRVSTEADNLLYKSFAKLYQHLGLNVPSVAIEIDLGVPLARGLGSSATAIVGGLVGANALAGNPLDLTQVRDLAIEMEGHPDNVVPALLGNCQLSVQSDSGWEICPIAWNEEVVAIVAIPEFELSTEEARSVLPKQVSRPDAIYNIAHFGLLLQGLSNNRGDWLKVALDDKLHQPYRKSLIKGYQEVELAAKKAGAYGIVISGAGPTLLALSDKNHQNAVAKAMESAWLQVGVVAQVLNLALDTEGATITQL